MLHSTIRAPYACSHQAGDPADSSRKEPHDGHRTPDHTSPPGHPVRRRGRGERGRGLVPRRVPGCRRHGWPLRRTEGPRCRHRERPPRRPRRRTHLARADDRRAAGAAEGGPPAPGLPGRRRHRAEPAHRPLRAAAEAAPLPEAGAPGHLPHRGLHDAHRRPDRPQGRAPADHARADPGEREGFHRAGLPPARPGEDRGPLQRRVALQARSFKEIVDLACHLPAAVGREPPRLPGADGPRRAAPLARDALLPDAGVRRLRAQVRRADRRLRPAPEHAGRPLDPGALRADGRTSSGPSRCCRARTAARCRSRSATRSTSTDTPDDMYGKCMRIADDMLDSLHRPHDRLRAGRGRRAEGAVWRSTGPTRWT